MTRALRAATPLTPGQLAAAAVLAGYASPGPVQSGAAATIARAREEGRPVEPALLAGRSERSRAPGSSDPCGTQHTARGGERPISPGSDLRR